MSDMSFQRLTSFLDSLTEQGIPACDCAVYLRNQPVYRHICGFKDAQKTIPASDEDIYWLYSATKLFTCTAVMQLIEQGRLKQENSVSQYLPEFENMKVLHNSGVSPAKNAMTIHHLLTMCGGLNYDTNTSAIIEARDRTNGQASTREMVTAIAQNPLSFEPGTHFQYSLCHDVLGAVIEVVSGQTFGDYLKENIFLPLKLKNTGFYLDDEKRNHMSAQYVYDTVLKISNEIPNDSNCFILSKKYESGGAGLMASVSDYILFASALSSYGVSANGQQILSKASIDLMRKDQLIGECVEDFRQLGKPGYSYGLGVRTMVDKVTTHAKSPIGEFGWDGAAGSYVLIDPENQLAIFYAQHVHNCGMAYSSIHPNIRDITYESLGL